MKRHYIKERGTTLRAALASIFGLEKVGDVPRTSSRSREKFIRRWVRHRFGYEMIEMHLPNLYFVIPGLCLLHFDSPLGEHTIVGKCIVTEKHPRSRQRERVDFEPVHDPGSRLRLQHGQLLSVSWFIRNVADDSE